MRIRVLADILLILKVGAHLDTFKETDAEPGIVRASLVLKAQRVLLLALVLPCDDCVSLPAKLMQAVDEASVSKVAAADSVLIFVVKVWIVTLVIFLSFDLVLCLFRDYLHIVLFLVFTQQYSEVACAVVEPLVL